jgi:quercetin dioxygenase-like cupin family protein
VSLSVGERLAVHAPSVTYPDASPRQGATGPSTVKETTERREYTEGFQGEWIAMSFDFQEVHESVNREPVIVQEEDLEWETWPNEEDVRKRGLVYFKTLVSSDVTRSGELTMGIAKIPPGEALRKHRHRQAEIYLILEGTGVVEIDSEARSVGAGSTVFIPGDAPHSCENTGASELRFAYVFPADSFEEIEYVFEE